MNHRSHCIAFAAGDDRNWWWPDAAGEHTLSAGGARAEAVDAFRDAFAALGYVTPPEARTNFPSEFNVARGAARRG